jgi:hypothetical protein
VGADEPRAIVAVIHDEAFAELTLSEFDEISLGETSL